MMAVALLLSSTVALAVTRQCKDSEACVGTKERDKLIGTENPDFMIGKGGADRLLGKGSADSLYGGGGADRLFAGPSGDAADFSDADYLYGGPGSDLLNGDENTDVYTFDGNKWGKDKIYEIDTKSQVQFRQLSAALTIRLISSSTAPEVTNANRTSTVNWSLPINQVYNLSTGDDTITGNLLNNWIRSSGGFDEIYGDMGDDYIIVSDDSGGDVVDCGEHSGDNDTVNFDSGDTVTNCETLIS